MSNSRNARNARIRRNKKRESRDQFLRNSAPMVQLPLNVCEHKKCSDCPEMDKCVKEVRSEEA